MVSEPMLKVKVNLVVFYVYLIHPSLCLSSPHNVMDNFLCVSFNIKGIHQVTYKGTRKNLI